MYIDNVKITHICSACGSNNVGKPLNDDSDEIKCFSCGHTKKKVIMGEGKADWYALPNKPRTVEF